MKKIILAAAVFAFANCCYSQNIPNPASLYVKFLGYKSEIKSDKEGNQRKVCILPDSSECDEWAFFRGTCGQAYSYCALKGYKADSFIDSTEGYKIIICKCIDPKNSEKKIPLLDFMMMHGDTLFKKIDRSKRNITY